MTEATAAPRALKFGTFELDVIAGELRKNGRKVPLPPQPLELLAALVERPGRAVSREELKNRLWPDDTYVDFDRSLNTAASKVREALGDSASSPRFIETLPRRGYRFLATVEGLPLGADETNEASRPVANGQGEGQSRRFGAVWVGIAIVSAVALAAFSFSTAPEPRPEAAPLRLTLTLPGYSETGEVADPSPVISPDGKLVAYVSVENRKLAVWNLSTDRHEVLKDTDRAVKPFWSPDSRSIGFWAEAGEIRRVDLASGFVTALSPAQSCAAGAWSWDGTIIIFGQDGMLFSVAAGGGSPAGISVSYEAPEHGQAGAGAFRPYFLPVEGKRLILFEASTTIGARLAVLDIDTGDEKLLTAPGDWGSPVYSSSGHVLYNGGETLWAVPFSLSELEVGGEPVAVASPAGASSVSADQTLLHEDLSGGRTRLIWVNREGERTGVISAPWPRMKYQSLSPDEKFIVALNDRQFGVHEVGRVNRLTLGAQLEFRARPVWGPTGQEILFADPSGVYTIPAIGLGPRRTVYDGAAGFVSDWSSDGAYVLYDRDSKDIWYLEPGEDGAYEPRPYMTSDFTEKSAQISSDNQWVAFIANPSGVFDVYLAHFPSGQNLSKVSTNGGRAVRWSRNGRRLYYTVGETLYEVDVGLDGEQPRIGRPRRVLAWPSLAASANASSYPTYDVSSDGERFVALEPLPGNEVRVRLAQSWWQEVQEREQAGISQGN